MWLQAIALAVPIGIAGYWTFVLAPCRGGLCVAPAFFLAALFIFGPPLVFVVWLAWPGRARPGIDVALLLGADVYALVASVIVSAIYGWYGSYVAMGAVAVTSLATAAFAIARLRRKPGDRGLRVGDSPD